MYSNIFNNQHNIIYKSSETVLKKMRIFHNGFMSVAIESVII